MWPVMFLILESLGSLEFAFILVMALVFFGPRKIPQVSRAIGKNLASFRRASEEFKSTWDREVSLEEFNMSRIDLETDVTPRQNSILDPEPIQPSLPTIEPVESDRVVPRQYPASDSSAITQRGEIAQPAEPLSKRDWL